MLQHVRCHRTTLVFSACCVWIAAVSAHDATLVIVHHALISQMERNPLGKWLIQINGGDVWLLVVVKLAGTAAVCTILVRLYRFRSDIALAVAVVLSGFQLLLLIHLHFG